jgi:hypothetical protein
LSAVAKKLAAQGVRRSGVRVEFYLPAATAREIDALCGRLGLRRREVALAAFTAYFAGLGQQEDLREVLKLARRWLAKQVAA